MKKYMKVMFGAGKAESGQAIVMIALIMVALIGMLGLAIDGGDLYFRHRDTQNAVDAAVLAALYTKCTTYPFATDSAVQASGLSAATSNGYTDGVNGATVIVDPSYLPTGETAWSSGFTPYVRASIDSPKTPFFIQLVFPGPMSVTSSTIGYCFPSMSNVLPGRSAIVSLRPTGCVDANPPFKVAGGADVWVHSGDIFINSDCSDKALWTTGNTDFHVDGNCLINGGNTVDGGSSMDCDSISDPGPLWSTHPLQDLMVPDQACNTSFAQSDPKGDGTVTISPGYYESITIQNGDHVTMEPGFYCIREFDLSGGGGDPGTLVGDGVVIYMPPGHSGWHSTAQSTFDLTAPNNDNCVESSNPLLNTCEWKDLLMWVDATDSEFTTPDTADGVHINGGADADWRGTIYAPRSQCHIEGSGEGYAMNAQLICWSVDLAGGSQLDIFYDPPDFLQTAPRLNLSE